MANNVVDNIADTFQNIFLAGVGALSIGGEKAKEVVDDLVERGQVTVEQGRKINEELKYKADESWNKFRGDSARAYVKSLSPEERANFAEQVAVAAQELNDAEEAKQASEQDEVIIEAEEVVEAKED